jgi:hypothetical protein
MPCFVTIIALITPRLAIVLLWLFSGWFAGIFSTALWPVLGFFFLPTTLLWFTAVHHWWGGQWSLWPIVGLVIALMIDVSPAKRRRPKPQSEG